jgi:hypothetical protein
MNTNFDWGLINENPWFKNVLIEEIFKNNIYQKFFKVEPMVQLPYILIIGKY